MSAPWIAGKRVLVTGASSGIGRELARAAAEQGAVLVLSGRRQHALDDVAASIAERGPAPPATVATDLSHRGSAAELAERAVAALGGVDALVNCAGTGVVGNQWSVGDRDEAREIFEANYWSPLALVHALVPAMRKRRSGAVVNVTSLGVSVPPPLIGHYTASKAALAAATDCMRLELDGTGVRVLEVVPGPTQTPLLDEHRLIPGGNEALKRAPIGDTRTLALRMLRAIDRDRDRLVYRRPLRLLYETPALARRVAAHSSKDVDCSDERVRTQAALREEAALAEASR